MYRNKVVAMLQTTSTGRSCTSNSTTSSAADAHHVTYPSPVDSVVQSPSINSSTQSPSHQSYPVMYTAQPPPPPPPPLQARQGELCAHNDASELQRVTVVLSDGRAHVRHMQQTIMNERIIQQQTIQHQYTPVDPNREYAKPIYSYSCLIALSLKNSQTLRLTVAEIYAFMW
jgi:hypothetical protein